MKYLLQRKTQFLTELFSFFIRASHGTQKHACRYAP